MTGPNQFEKLQELFHAAMKLPPVRRRDFFAKVRLRDASMADELESLVRDAMSLPASGQDDSPSEGSAERVLPAGSRIGRYEVVGFIGAGAMGQVYLARDEALEREVALKLLPEKFAVDPNRKSRFRL